MDLTLLGIQGDGGDSVVCHTNLTTCCSMDQGEHRGHWYFPNMTKLQIARHGDSIYKVISIKRVDLLRDNNVTSPSGIYRCDVPTNIPHQDPVRLSVYVGLYLPSEGNSDS